MYYQPGLGDQARLSFWRTMSHFTEMKCKFLVANEKELVAALEAQFGEGKVEVHKDGADLYGYRGDNRGKVSAHSPDYAPPCHIIIRRKNVGSSANDIGYRRMEDGTYRAYISEYDQRSTFKKDKRDAVEQDYATRVAEKALKKKGYTLKRTVEKDGTIKIVATRYG